MIEIEVRSRKSEDGGWEIEVGTELLGGQELEDGGREIEAEGLRLEAFKTRI